MHGHNTHHAITLGHVDMTPLFGPRGQAAPHATHYIKAIEFIQSHGHFAAITKDGLLAMSTEWASSDTFEAPLDDATYAEPMLFDVDEDGMVLSRDVRIWLGY